MLRQLWSRFIEWVFADEEPRCSRCDEKIGICRCEWRCDQCGALDMDCSCQDPIE